MKKVDVTVLMPVYNGARYLRSAIDSILKQDYTDFEFIIIDDGSVDKSAEIIKSYHDPRISFISNSVNIGLVNSLNKGIEAARGKYIARFDQDDISHPARLSRQLAFVRRQPQFLLVGSDCIVIDENSNPITAHGYPSSHAELVQRLLKLKAFFPHSSALFEKTEVKRIGGYNKRLEGAEDFDLWLRISEAGSIGCVGEPLIKLRKHSSSMTATNITLSWSLQISAGVCFLLRKAGYVDPSQVNTDVWKTFFNWVIHSGEFNNTIDERLIIEELRQLYNHQDENYFQRLCRVFLKLMKSPIWPRVLLYKIRGSNVVYKLASAAKVNGLLEKVKTG